MQGQFKIMQNKLKILNIQIQNLEFNPISTKINCFTVANNSIF